MPITRNMDKESGNKIIKVLIKCLTKEDTQPRFRWFDYDETEWDQISEILETILPRDTDIGQNPSTLETLLGVWASVYNAADDERKKELNVAAMTAVQNLQFNNAGREIWFNFVKTDGELDWDPHGDAQEQDWVEKMRRIIHRIHPALKELGKKMDNAKGVVEIYEEYQKLKEKYGSSDLSIQVLLGKANVDEVKEGIGKASDKVRKWLTLLNSYYDYTLERQWLGYCKLFFPGGGVVRKAIDWTEFLRLVKEGKR